MICCCFWAFVDSVLEHTYTTYIYVYIYTHGILKPLFSELAKDRFLDPFRLNPQDSGQPADELPK